MVLVAVDQVGGQRADLDEVGRIPRAAQGDRRLIEEDLDIRRLVGLTRAALLLLLDEANHGRELLGEGGLVGQVSESPCREGERNHEGGSGEKESAEAHQGRSSRPFGRAPVSHPAASDASASERPDHRHEEHRDDAEQRKQRQSQLPVVAEPIAAGPITMRFAGVATGVRNEAADATHTAIRTGFGETASSVAAVAAIGITINAVAMLLIS